MVKQIKDISLNSEQVKDYLYETINTKTAKTVAITKNKNIFNNIYFAHQSLKEL